jgi:hypothetical protein
MNDHRKVMTKTGRTGRFRNAVAVAAGNVLCAIRLDSALFAVLRLTGAEQLMALAHTAGDDPAAHAEALAKYPDPFGLVMESVPFWLEVVACAVALIVGMAVGFLTGGRSPWLGVASVAP